MSTDLSAAIEERMRASALYPTIHRQPADLRALRPREDESITRAVDLLRNARRVITTGIGTSHHASIVGSWLLREAGLDAVPVHAFDLALYSDHYPAREGDVVIVFGHTGTTTLTRRALEARAAMGTPAIAVGGLTAEHPGASVILRTTEPERSATYTSSHLSAMVMVAHLAVELGADELLEPLSLLPDLVQSLLDREAEVWPIAERAEHKRIYAAGGGPNEATATELMIKAREAAYAWIDGMAIEQFLHGPAVGVNAGDLAIIFNPAGASSGRSAEIARTLAAMGAELWLVGAAVEGVEATVFDLPTVPEPLSPLLAVVPAQLLAARLAALKGTNPDSFRRDDPIYKAAFDASGF